MSTKQQFMSAAKTLTMREVQIGELSCCVKPMSLRVMSRVRNAISKHDEAAVARETIKGCICDADGKQMFSDKDDELINDWPAEFVQQVLEVINPVDDEETPQGN